MKKIKVELSETYLKYLDNYRKMRISDLKEMNFPDWSKEYENMSHYDLLLDFISYHAHFNNLS